MARGVRELIRGVRSIGLANMAASVRYSIIRDRMNARLRKRDRPTPAITPGDLQTATPTVHGARFTFEHAELEILFLAPDVIRCSWSPGEPPVPYAIADFAWSGDSTNLTRIENGWSLAGSQCRLELSPTGDLRFCTLTGRVLQEDGPPHLAGRAWSLESNLAPEAVVTGLGERAAGLDLRGRRYRFWNLDPGGGYGAGHDPLYLSIPVYYVLQRAGGYLLFHENSHDGWIEFNQRLKIHFEGGLLRTYFIPGQPGQALARYSDLTGRAPLPPLWALGYHQSRWGYRTEAEIRELASRFAEHQLPLSAIHLDLDYMDGNRIFTVDEERFPQLGKLASDLLEKGIRLVTIIDPGVKAERGYHVYSSGLEREVFCRRGDERLLHAPVWPGWCAFPDFSASETRSWWSEQYPRLLDQGIAGVWHDMNEPAAFAAWGEPTLPLDTQHALEGQGGDHRSAHNLYGLLMNRAGYETLRRYHPQRRPFILTRSGWAGVQRYAWSWSGDTESSWEMLERTIATLLGMGMSGLPFVGSDIGGFSGKPDAELYLRWLQLAAFTPFFRTHSALGTERREPWAFGEDTLTIARKALRLRQTLMPYIYSQAWVTSTQGIPLMRPTFWADPADEDLWQIDDQFMLGDALLVAPVLIPGAPERQVTLPTGSWVEFHSGEVFEGPGEITLPVEMDRIPVLVRGGSLLPLAVQGGINLRLTLPGPDGEAGTLYRDGCDGYGAYRLERFELVHDEGLIRLHCQTAGDFQPKETMQLEIVGENAGSIAADGQPLDRGERGWPLPPFQTLEIKLP
jgi:alpha-glucosidase